MSVTQEPPGASAPVLEGRALKKSFGGVQALQGPDIELGPNEILGLLGPNGSGKSTLVNCLSGVFRPDSGSVRMGSHEISHWSSVRRSRAGLGRTFQNLRLFDQLTVAENVEVGFNALRRAPSRKAARRRQLELLEEFDLSRLAHATVGSLAYGDRRRVELARSAAAEPSVLLLDEPAAGLNEVETETLARSLRAIRDKGCAMLLIDHDVSFVTGLADRVQVLDEGRTIFVGTPSEARQSPVVIEAYLGAEAAADHA